MTTRLRNPEDPIAVARSAAVRALERGILTSLTVPIVGDPENTHPDRGNPLQGNHFLWDTSGLPPKFMFAGNRAQRRAEARRARRKR